ncbi:MAG: ABC transporter ATP-binding protein [Desulfonatronovibrio sp.]
MNKDKIAIKAHKLTKSFDNIRAVDGVDFEVFSGELFGFLGPNGAGKTTTINILTGLARPDSGTFSISGMDCVKKPRSAQHLMGVVPDESNLYPELSGVDNLCFFAALYGMKKQDRRRRAEELLDMFDLTQAAKRKFSTYSKGMKRKLTIAAGIIHQPEILFLDEPTTGIDVASARHLRRLIADLNSTGTTIFLTTHMIEEAEKLCQRIAFIVNGKIQRIDSLSNLLKPFQDRHILQVVCSTSVSGVLKKLEAKFPNQDFSTLENGIIKVESDSPVQVGPLVRFLEDTGIEVLEARRIRQSLEEVFVRITGIEAHDLKKTKADEGSKK